MVLITCTVTMILWSSFYKMGAFCTLFEWSRKQMCNIYKMKTYVMALIMKKSTQKNKWALFTKRLQIKLFKNENLLQSVQNS